MICCFVILRKRLGAMRGVIGFILLATLASCFGEPEGPQGVPNNWRERLAEDIEIIDEYIIDNNIDAEQHSSGIFFQHHELGTGATPTGSDSVNLTYEIRLLIEGWVDEGENVDFWMGHLIQAWQISLQWMQEGGRMTIYAPTLYCYGPLGTGPIPPNSILVFDIELHSTTAGD